MYTFNNQNYFLLVQIVVQLCLMYLKPLLKGLAYVMLPEMLVICHCNYLQNLYPLVSEGAKNVCVQQVMLWFKLFGVDEKFNHLKTLKCV